MHLYTTLQYGVFLLIVTALVYPIGVYLTRVFAGESTWLDPGLRPLERVFYRLAGIDAPHEMDWKEYASAFVVFSLAGTLLLYALFRIQPLLHTFDPIYHPAPLSPDLAMNTAISFITTTTWQAYGGETTMSYLSQIVGLVVQNFLAGAAGLAVGIAFIRGLARERTTGLGNFWVDLTERCSGSCSLSPSWGGCCSSGRACPPTSGPITRCRWCKRRAINSSEQTATAIQSPIPVAIPSQTRSR